MNKLLEHICVVVVCVVAQFEYAFVVQFENTLFFSAARSIFFAARAALVFSSLHVFNITVAILTIQLEPSWVWWQLMALVGLGTSKRFK
jgi:hypothetical protein